MNRSAMSFPSCARTKAGLDMNDPEDAEFGLEVVIHVLTTMIMEDLQADRDISKHTF
jgi:hypothetical protein